MQITLTPEMEKLLNQELATGDYVSPSHVLHEGLFLLRASRIPKKERLENLRREIQKGIDEIRAGNYTTYNVDELDDFVEEIIERGKKRLAEKNGGR